MIYPTTKGLLSVWIVAFLGEVCLLNCAYWQRSRLSILTAEGGQDGL